MLPSATAFDAISSLASAGIYMIVALAALAHAPRDPRVRLFLATAAAGLAPYCVTAQIWAWGAAATFTKTTIIVLALSLAVGSLALFHFTQLFPWRRPWIRAHAAKLWAGYVILPVLAGIAALVVPGPASDAGAFGALSHDAAVFLALATVAIVLPIVFVLGVVVPLAGLLSLYKSWLAARAHHVEAARISTQLMLISQMGGGVLTILIVPLLRLVAPRGTAVTAASALLFACAMLMPAAFAMAVWKFGVLQLDLDGLPH